MKTLYLFIGLILLTANALPQGIVVTKSDGTTISFTLAEIDSMQISTDAAAKSISAENWNCYVNTLSAKTALTQGIYENVEEGLKISTGSGSGTTVLLMPANQVVLSEKSLYIRWKLENTEAAVNITLFQAPSLSSSVVTLSPQGSKLQSGIWYYSRITITGSTVNTVTCSENFSNNGGIPVASMTTSVNNQITNFAFSISSARNAAVILAEAHVE